MAQNIELENTVLAVLCDYLEEQGQVNPAYSLNFIDLLKKVVLDEKARIKIKYENFTIYGYDFNNENARKEHNSALETTPLSGKGEILVAQGISAHYAWYITKTK